MFNYKVKKKERISRSFFCDVIYLIFSGVIYLIFHEYGFKGLLNNIKKNICILADILLVAIVDFLFLFHKQPIQQN